MKRPNLRLLSFLTPMAMAASLAQAAPGSPPSTAPGPSAPYTDQLSKVQEYQGIGVDRHLSAFTGIVLDVSEHPIAGVEVQLFVDGQPTGSAKTDGSGIYQLQVTYDASSDATALLWFTPPPDHSLMQKELVLKESKASAANGLISRCVPRAAVLPGRQFRVYLFDPASRNKELSELDCLP